MYQKLFSDNKCILLHWKVQVNAKLNIYLFTCILTLYYVSTDYQIQYSDTDYLNYFFLLITDKYINLKKHYCPDSAWGLQR